MIKEFKGQIITLRFLNQLLIDLISIPSIVEVKNEAKHIPKDVKVWFQILEYIEKIN
jgi:hypothetical protein